MTYPRFIKKSTSTVRRHRLIVERVTRTNQGGFITDVWADVGEYWGSLDPVSERQMIAYQTIGTECTHIVNVSAMADIKEEDRIRFKDRYFEVLTAVNLNEIERDKIITTKEIRPK